MKTQVYPALVLALALGQSQAVPIASDSFANDAGGADYDIGNLGGQSATVGTTGYTGSWSSGTAAMQIAAGGLTHILTPGPTSAGQIIAFTGTGSAERRLVRAIDYTPTDGMYYFSALFRKTEASTSHDMLAGLGPSESATSGFGSSQATYMGIWNGGFQFSPGGNTFTEILTPAELNVDETYFGLMEISYSSTGADSVTVKIHDGAASLIAEQTFGGLDLDGDIGRLSLATKDFAPTVGVDEWRFGTELADVQAALSAPTLASEDIVDDQIVDTVTQGTLVTYTVSFSQDMDDTTVTAADFGNAGSSSANIGVVTETGPGVFSVPVTPTSAGTLQLQVNQAAVLSDAFGSDLDTTAAILDDTTITVTLTDTTAPTLVDITDDSGGGTVALDTLVTYTVTFSEDMDDTTVDASDFGVTGTAGVSIGTVTETAPGVFTVPVTVNSVGSMQLRINQGAVLSDLAGNAFDTTVEVLDGEVISVVDLDAFLVAYYPFDSDYNDATGNGYDGSLTDVGTTGNSGLTTTPGEFKFGGGALDLSSERDFVAVPAINLVTDANGWSVAFWARDRNAQNAQDGMVIGVPTNTTDFIWVDTNFGGVRTRTSASGFTADFTLPAEDTAWHHYVLVAEDGDSDTAFDDLTLYRDGVFVDTKLNEAGANFDITAIGHAFSGSQDYDFDGQIDEVYLYDIAINAARVAELFAGPADNSAPSLLDIVDDQSGGPVTQGTLITYAVTFDEDIDAATLTAADFGDAGGDVTFIVGAITETSPGVFAVEITPTLDGTLELQINAGAVVQDGSGNALDTSVALVDGTSIVVDTDNTAPTLAGSDIVVDWPGGPVNQGVLVTYTVTFSEGMDASTVEVTDFGNAGTSTISIGTVTETSPGVFSVEITPTTPGTLQLQVNQSAVLSDLAGNDLDTSSAILDDTTLTVVEGEPNLVAYYPFDSDFLDASGNGNHLNVENGTPDITSAAGETVFGGGALNLTGSDNEWLSLGTPLTYGASDPWSVSFWARRTGGATEGMVMGNGGVRNSFIWGTDNFNGMRFRPQSSTSASNDFTAPKDDNYHHFVIVADGTGALTLYVDGGAPETKPSATGGTSFTINAVGHAYDSLGLSFAGQLDEIHIYDAAIDAAKVAELYSVGAESAFDSWATANGVPTGSEAIDSDAGGRNNIYEFGLGGNPATGNDDDSLLHAFSADVAGGPEEEGILTILVRADAVGGFSTADPSVSTAVDGIVYTVAADVTPEVDGGGLTVTPTTAVTTGLPAPPAGYQYVSFYVTGAEAYFQVTVASE